MLNESNWSVLMTKSSKKHVSNIVSVCGDTHSGKSTIISGLLQEADKYVNLI